MSAGRVLATTALAFFVFAAVTAVTRHYAYSGLQPVTIGGGQPSWRVTIADSLFTLCWESPGKLSAAIFAPASYLGFFDRRMARWLAAAPLAATPESG